MRIQSLIVALASALVALTAPACSKDKPPEAPAEPPKVESETPAEAKPDETKAEPAKTDETKGEEAKVADAKGERDAKARLRAEGREHLGRRPPPLRHGETKVEGEPKPDEPIGDGGAPVAKPMEDPAHTGTVVPPSVAPVAPPADVAVVPDPSEPPPAVPPGTPPVVAEAPPTGPHIEIRDDANGLDAASRMPQAAVLEITGQQLGAGQALPGIAKAAGYGSVMYPATDATKFGASLQIWQDPTKRDTDDRFRRMRFQYPNAEDIAVLNPSKSFFSYFGAIQSLTFVEPTKRMVVTVTCGEAICSHEQLVRLAKSIRARL